MTDEKIRKIEDGAFPINEELAGLVPMAMEAEQLALTEDIRANGLRDAIVLWKGEVVDGRCRQTALVSLGMRIIYKELDSKLTEDEVAVFVKSVNTRRNLSMSQKAMSAAISKIKGRDTRSIAVIAKSWGMGKDLVSNAKFIMTQDSKIGTDLFNGKSVDIVDSKGKTITSSKITAVYAHLKRITEGKNEDEAEHGWSADSHIVRQDAKDWFYEQRKLLGYTDVLSMMQLADHANLKFGKSK